VSKNYAVGEKPKNTWVRHIQVFLTFS